MGNQTTTRNDITIAVILSAATMVIWVFSVWVWWDFLKNDQNNFGEYLAAPWGVVSVCLFFFFFLYIQLWAESIFLELISLIGTLFFIPLIIVSFAHLYYGLDICVTNEQKVAQIGSTPESCAYFSTVTFTTLGYGDITPTISARKYTAFQALLGFLIVPIIISQIVNLIRDIKAKRESALNTMNEGQSSKETHPHLDGLLKSINEDISDLGGEIIKNQGRTPTTEGEQQLAIIVRIGNTFEEAKRYLRNLKITEIL